MSELSWVVSWIFEDDEHLGDELECYSLAFYVCVTEEEAQSVYAQLKVEGHRIVILSRVVDATAPPWFESIGFSGGFLL